MIPVCPASFIYTLQKSCLPRIFRFNAISPRKLGTETEEGVETGIKKNNPENSSCQEIEKEFDLKLKSSKEMNGELENTCNEKNQQENMEIIKTSSHAQNGIDGILTDNDILKSNGNSDKGKDVTADVKHKEEIDRKTSDSDSNKVDEVLSRSVRRRISINEAPEFIERLGSFKDSNVGEDVTLVCKFKAWPRPSVTWFRDDNEVKETARHSFENIFEGEESLAKLYIKDVDSRDEGCYKCRVENGEGFASTTGYLSVSGKSAKSDSDRSRSPSPSSRKGSSPGRRGDRSLTPSGLRPILEQKSIEEREAEEYRSLGPSPIQEFIDVVNYKRRGRLTKRAKPLVFCPAELYSDDSSSFDQEDEEISATVQDTATDSDVTLSPDMTPTLTSSPELSDIWAHGPLKFAFLPNASNNAMQHAIQDTCTDSLLKNTEKLIEAENFKDEFSSLDKPKTRSFENVSGTAEKTQIEGRTLNKGSLDSIISTKNDQNTRIPDSQYHSLADIQSKDIGSSHFVNPLPVWQTTSQVVYPMSDPRDKCMRMVDDSDYDSDTTPTSTPEVEISDPRLHVRYYTAHLNELNKSKNQEQERESTPKNDPSNEISKSKIDILSPVKLDGDKISDTTNTTQRIGRSLQERRSRMLSDTMRQATSETRAEDFSSARVTSPYKSLSVSIKTAARRPSLPNSGDTSGVVLLSADKPPALDSISLASGNSATTSNSVALAAEKSPRKRPQDEIKTVENDNSISSQQSTTLKKVEKVEEKPTLVTPRPTIRTTSRVIAKPACGNVRSRSVDITIRTSSKTPVENISSGSTENKNASTKVNRVSENGKEADKSSVLNTAQTKVISQSKLEDDCKSSKESSNDSVAKSEISQDSIGKEQKLVEEKSSISKNTVIRTSSRAVAKPTHDNRRSRSVDITVKTSNTPIQNTVSSREDNNCKVIVNNAEVGGEFGLKIVTSAAASSGRSVETADCGKLKQISSTGTDIRLQKPKKSVNEIPAIQEKQEQKITQNITEAVVLTSSVKPVLKEYDTAKKVKEFEETETVSTVALSVSNQTDYNSKSDTNKFEINSKPSHSVEKITGYAVNNVDTETIILATSNIKEQITVGENLNKTIERNSSAVKSEVKSSFETSPKVISVSVRSPSPCTAINVLSRQVQPVDQRRQGASNISRAVKISTKSAAENQILTSKPVDVSNDLKATSAVTEISFSKKSVIYNAETSESVSKTTISEVENIRSLHCNPLSLKLLASNVIPKITKGTRAESEKIRSTCVVDKDEKKLKDNTEEINYMRVVVDKVFNALNYANVQFYLLFISLATALAAASAASSGRTIFASFSPFLFVCSSVVAVIISEVTQFTRERKHRQQIGIESLGD